MTLTAVAEKLYTVEAYFELEKRSEVRHEFYYGKLIEMPGESKIANRIANNIMANWRKPLIDKDYEMYSHDVKAQVKYNGIYRYPDIVVAPYSDDSDDFVVKEAVIMVEVASIDSMRRDSVTKLKEYSGLATVQYYLVVSQDEASVQFFYRNGKDWSFIMFEDLEDLILMPKFDLHITVADIYDRVKFI
jgi:Uma2 family endonuclease